jgi:protein PhnA
MRRSINVRCAHDRVVSDSCAQRTLRALSSEASNDGRTGEAAMAVKDSNGNVLSDGDSVIVIKDLKVKGASIPLKRGTVIRNISLVEDDDEHVEGHSDKIRGLVLKACFLKKA